MWHVFCVAQFSMTIHHIRYREALRTLETFVGRGKAGPLEAPHCYHGIPNLEHLIWVKMDVRTTVIYCDGQCWNMLDDLNLWGNYAPQIWTTAGIPWAASAEPYLDLWRLVWFLSGRPRSRDGPMYCIYGSSFLPFVSCPCVPAVVVSNCWPTKLLRLLYMTHE